MTDIPPTATVRCNMCMSYFDEDEIGPIFECPKCKTEAYLMDAKFFLDQKPFDFDKSEE